MGDKYNPIIVPENLNPKDDTSDKDEKLGSLTLSEEADLLKPPTEEEKEKEGLLQGIKDKFLSGKDAAAEAIQRAFVQNYVQKITHCLPHSEHPTKKRFTKAEVKSKRKREKLARRQNRNNRLNRGMKWGRKDAGRSRS